jgi:hypothetical protein
MLAMLSVVLLQAVPLSVPSTANPSAVHTPSTQLTRESSRDYFSTRHRKDSRAPALSPGWPALPSIATSPNTTPVPAAMSSTWGRNSWSSLFQSNLSAQHAPDGLPMGSSHSPTASPSTPGGIPVPKQRGRPITTPELLQRSQGQGNAAAWNSWAASRPSPLNRTPVSFSSAGHARQRQRTGQEIIEEKVVVANKRICVVKVLGGTTFVPFLYFYALRVVR